MMFHSHDKTSDGNYDDLQLHLVTSSLEFQAEANDYSSHSLVPFLDQGTPLLQHDRHQEEQVGESL